MRLKSSCRSGRRKKKTVRSLNENMNAAEKLYADEAEQVSKRRKKTADRFPVKYMNAAEKLYADEAGQTSRRKPNHRRALIAAAAVIVVLILGVAPATYSYLTASSKTVVNTFAGGAISLTLDEAKVDTDGVLIEGEPRVQENTYKVVPGAELYKDPTVTVLEGSEVCYVYLYVENPLDENYFTLDYSSDWIEVAVAGTKTLYVYKTTVDASDGDVALTPIFTTVTVSDELTSDQIEAMGEVQIEVQAYAVQAADVDTATGILMAADYFEAEFDFEFTDVNTAVEIDGLIDETTDEETVAADTADDTDTSSDTADKKLSSDETDTTDAAASDEELEDTDAAVSDEEPEDTDAAVSDEESEDTDDTEADSTLSEEASSDDAAETDSSDLSETNNGQNVNTESIVSSADTAASDIAM